MAKKKTAQMTKAERDDLVSLLGEGFHAAFRKATFHELATPTWKNIKALPPREWASVLDFVMMCVGPFVDELLEQRSASATKVAAVDPVGEKVTG